MKNILNNKLMILSEPCHGMGTTAFSELVAKEASVDGRVLVFGDEEHRYKVDKTILYCLDDVTRLENIVNNYTEKISLYLFVRQ